MNIGLYYDDIALIANYFDGDSRAQLDTSVQLGNQKFKLPIMPANMKCSIDFLLSKQLSEAGYFYVMHRFFSKSVLKDWIKDSQNLKTISISIGVQLEDFEFISWLAQSNLRVDYITVDIAHGYCKSMKNMLKHINREFILTKPFIICGNVMTEDAVRFLYDCGADCAKCLIGTGKVCSTKLKTGFTSPSFSTILECSKSSPIPIIADGGIQHNGDISKALVAGATMTMAGNMFAGCIDSPAENVMWEVSTEKYKPTLNDCNSKIGTIVSKRYFGSASEENKGTKKNIEGFCTTIPCNKMTYAEKMDEITMDLQSAMSYGGIDNVKDFYNTVRWRSLR